jgi:cation transport ATPase
VARADRPDQRAWRKEPLIAGAAVAAIALHLVLRAAAAGGPTFSGLRLDQLPLVATLLLGGVPLVLDLLAKLARREFGSDLLAGLSIVTSVLLGEYLAGALVVLMLSGRATLEAYAVRSATTRRP